MWLDAIWQRIKSVKGEFLVEALPVRIGAELCVISLLSAITDMKANPVLANRLIN